MSNLESFKNLFSSLGSVSADRMKSFERFEAIGLPTKANEAWKYTSLKSIRPENLNLPSDNKTAISINDLALKDTAVISCLNGTFDIVQIKKDLAPYMIDVMTFSDALIAQKIKLTDSKDSFSALNSAFYEKGLYLEVSPESKLHKPLVIEHKVSEGSFFINPKIYIEMKDESSMELVECFALKSLGYLLNSSLHINIGKRASLKAAKYFNEQYVSSHIDNTMIWQAESSSCQFIQLGRGSQLSRQNLEVSVDGSSANTDLRGISLLAKDSHMDNFVKIHHKAPSSTSKQAFRSILRDQAHYVFQGNIRIERLAQKTDSDQVNRNLMLGEKCHVDTKPQLDVFADDVKATHGAAIGQLNPDEKFYLESRAISPEMALSLLCDGFALDLLEDLKSSWIKNYLRGNL